MLEKIKLPGDYLYTPVWPAGCRGHAYRAHRMVIDVPS